MPEEKTVIRTTDREMLDNLINSTDCLACGGKKRKRQSFCYSCYMRLPKGLQHRLYQRFDEGYQPAFREALSQLRSTASA